MNARERGYVLSLARRWHVPVEDRPSTDFPWDGTTIGLKDHFETILHDMAHHLVCCARDPARLTRPDFGLNEDPYKAMGPKADAEQHEEELASALGIEWQRRGRFPWKATASLHCWEDKSEDYAARVEELRQMGILR